MTFAQELSELGFERVHASRNSERFAARGGRYLQLWVHTRQDGTAVFTWEYELGAFLKDKGFAISAQDELSLMLFPPTDASGPAEVAWVAEQIEATESQLGSLQLLGGNIDD